MTKAARIIRPCTVMLLNELWMASVDEWTREACHARVVLCRWSTGALSSCWQHDALLSSIIAGQWRRQAWQGLQDNRPTSCRWEKIPV